MTALIVVPEPSPWLDGLAQEYPDAVVLAPWACAGEGPAWLPTPVSSFRRRRVHDSARSIPGWQLLEGLARAWAGSRAERKLQVRFTLRRAVNVVAARAVALWKPDIVIAPSCAARRSFAQAHSIGAKTVLVEDVADIRELHRDLDHAASAHPDFEFLGRYRAPTSVVIRQRSERVLADQILVRGNFARSLRLRDGFAPDRVAALPCPQPPRLQSWGQRPHRVLLAGLATARHGAAEAALAVQNLPGVELLVRCGEGTEPSDLLDRDRVRRYRGDAVNVVIAPHWCESYASEIAMAAAAGLPIVATERAAGFASVRKVRPGDDRGLCRAIESALASQP